MQPNHKIKDVFFDLDHTLWDFDANSEMAFETILRQNYPAINIKNFIDKYVPINQECWKLYQNDEISHQELRYNRLKLSFDALNYDISDTQINKIADDYIELLPNNNKLFEGAIEVLEYLNRKYSLHIITNGFANVQFKKIKNSKIDSFFKTITNSELAGSKKPHPAIFKHALDVANAKNDFSIMIGDSLEADIQGALNFGIDAIFFNPNRISIPKNIKQVNHLLDLKTYL